MFCYQCRYCKGSFDQWEKLVRHRRNEHIAEFEALKTALLLRKEEAARHKLLMALEMSDYQERSVPTSTSSERSVRNMKPYLRGRARVSSSRSIHRSGRFDEKDLFGHEISLCIPGASSGYSSSRSSSPSSSPSSTTCETVCFTSSSDSSPSSYPDSPQSESVSSTTSISSPYDFERDRIYQEGYYRWSDIHADRIVPPLQRLLDLDWSPTSKKPIAYHEINDGDEIQISVSPHDGSHISVTTLTHIMNYPTVEEDDDESFFLNADANNISVHYAPQKHVVFESLEDELQITCSAPAYTAVQEKPRKSKSDKKRNSQRYREKRLKRLLKRKVSSTVAKNSHIAEGRGRSSEDQNGESPNPKRQVDYNNFNRRSSPRRLK